MWGTLVDYWHYTGDTAYNKLSSDSMIFQAGAPQNSYMPPNWTASLGNDDQGFWGLSAMLAAEVGFPNPPPDQPQWLALAQAVFNTQAAPDRHDDTCNGGLRWQIPNYNVGYDYKNAISNGIFFNLGARLARYTGNQTYADIATKTWNWVTGVGLMDSAWNVYDGGHVQVNCTDIFKAQFSYNAAIFLQGAAFMYNFVSETAPKLADYFSRTNESPQTNGSDVWKERTQGLVDRTVEVFFHNGPAVEVSCELQNSIQCKTDMLSFKGYLHRWMAQTTQVAPFTHEKIMATLQKSTAAAVKSCQGGPNGRQCGFRWTTGQFDGLLGAGQQMNALAALSSLLVDQAGIKPPLTNSTGGTSQGNPNAGQTATDVFHHPPPTTGDKAGASILTILILGGIMSSFVWMSTGLSEKGM